MTSAPITRLGSIQALRAIAALMVVAIHIQANELRLGDPVLSPWLYHGVAGVDLFFVISGFIMVHVTRGRFDTAGQPQRFLWDRLWRIYPPALLFTFLTLMALMAAGTVGDWLPQTDLLASFLLLPQEGEPLLGVAWTLTHELYFYLVFCALLVLKERWLPIGLTVWGSLIAIGLASGISRESGPWLVVAFHPHTYEFIFGAFAGLAYHRGWIRIPALILAAGIAALMAGALWIGLRTPENYPLFWGRVLAFGPASVLIVAGIAGLEQRGQLRFPDWSQRIGDWSYSLYLSHVLVIVTLTHLWLPRAMPGPIDNLALIFAMLAGSLIVSALAYYVYERPALALGKRLRRTALK
ncbi:acyltransferase family protein [Hyphobacterium sp.]|uniref:acyltransferase family protein n=1 Tax=Hyphobacterium sp. TaxID=2004662 RepID=UPI003BAAFFA5